MRYQLFKGLVELGASARKKTTVQSSLFGSVDAEGPINPARVARGCDGKRRLIVEMDAADGKSESGVLSQITVGETRYDLVESEPSPDEKRSDVLHKRFSKRADWLIDCYGLQSTLKVAELNSRLDILTSYLAIGLRIGVACAATVGLAFAAFEGRLYSSLMQLKEEATESTETLMEIGLAGLFGFAAFAWFKQFLDDSQDVLLNRMKLTLKANHPEKYRALLEIGDRLMESGDVKTPEDNWFFVMVEKVPLLGNFTRKILEHWYNIEFEKRELAALEELGEYLKGVGGKSTDTLPPPERTL